LILLCNDDGIGAPGLIAAAEALTSLGDLVIVAPRHQQSAMGRSHPLGADVGRIDTEYLNVAGHEHIAYAVFGSAAIACAHGILEVCPRQPDLCVSGINYGENYGYDLVSLSGTLGVTYEAAAKAVPAIAASLEVDTRGRVVGEFVDMDWAAAMHFTARLAARVLTEGLPPEVAVLNMNIPAGAHPTTPVRKTSHSRQQYYQYCRPLRSSWDTPVELPTKVDIDRATLEPDSDIQAVVFDRVVSITPLTWSLTAVTDWQPGPELIFD
jgi:5'-nucleotidase